MAWMLSIGKLGQGQADYYLDSVAGGIEDYYTGAGEAPGRWLGAASGELEVSSEVAGNELHAVLNGGHPSSGDPLVQRRGGTRVPGFDLTFSAPKSVSVLFGVGDSEVSSRVRDAHEAAVDAALEYMERHCAVARRGHGGAESVLGNGFVAAAFRHRTSRAGDPQLHTHVLVANMTCGPDGRWTALDGRRLYAHAKTGGYLYQAQLRFELTRRLGVEWTPIHNGTAEIAGIPPTLLRAFSRRRVEIEHTMDQRREQSARAAQYAALDTRHAKDYGVAPEQLADRWRRQAQRLGLERDQLSAVVGREHERTLSPADRDAVADALASPSGLTRQRSTFTRRDVIQAWCEQLPTGGRVGAVEEVADEFLASDRTVSLAQDVSSLTHSDVIRRVDGRVVAATAEERRYSTPELLELERDTIERALRRAGAGAGVVDPGIVEDAVERRPTLSGEQAAMVRRLTCDGDGVQVVTGKAGAGKTFGLDAAREAWQRQGRPVVGAAVARRAAHELQDGAGIESTSLTALLSDVRELGLADGSVVVVDEASMAGTRQLAELLDHAETARAKVVLVGDDRQLPAIEAGGIFRALLTRLEPIELLENRRQVEAWERKALDHLREGRPERAIEAYQRHGRLFVASDAEEVREQLVADWFDAVGSGDAVMVAARRDDVADLNGRARGLMRASNQLGDDALTIADREFTTGDRVVLLKNANRLGVTNGTRGIVRAVDVDAGQLELRTTDGRQVRLPSSYLFAATKHGGRTIDHGYAITGHKAQGMTTTRAFVLGTDDLYREWGYVAMSRGREENRIYVVAPGDHDREEYAPHEKRPDPIEALINALRYSQAQSAAIDIASRDGLRAMTTKQLVQEHSRLAQELEEALPQDREPKLAGLSSQRASAERIATQAARLVARLEEQMPRRRRGRDPELAGERARAAQARERVAELAAQEQRLREPRPELGRHAAAIGRYAVIGEELDRRWRHAARAAAIEKPAYLTAELGPYPDRPSRRRTWERAATRIEMYRDSFGVTDENTALGKEPWEHRQRDARRIAHRDLDRARRELGRGQARTLEQGRGIG